MRHVSLSKCSCYCRYRCRSCTENRSEEQNGAPKRFYVRHNVMSVSNALDRPNTCARDLVDLSSDRRDVAAMIPRYRPHLPSVSRPATPDVH